MKRTGGFLKWRRNIISAMTPIQLAESEFRLSCQVSGGCFSGYSSRRSRPTNCVSDIHGAWRRLDGLSLRRLFTDTFRVSGRLGLVPQHLSRIRLIREQHLETYVGDSTCRRPEASGDSPSARDFQVFAMRVVPMG